MDEEIEIPNDIDERLYGIFEKDEFFGILIGFMVGAHLLGMVLGLLCGFAGYRFTVRFKARQPRGVIRHWLYRAGIMNFRGTRWCNGLQREVFGK